MRIVFEVAGDVQLNRDILRVSGRAQDMAPAFGAVASLWMSETRKQFETEGRHASGGWAPLKTATLQAKRRKRLRPEILRATDALMRSLTVREDDNLILRVGPSELDYGSKLPYAEVHQRPKPSNPLPQRRPVAFTEAARRQTVKICQRYLLTGAVA